MVAVPPLEVGSMVARMARFVAALLLLAGAVLTGRAGYMHAKAQLAKVLIHRAWEENVQSGKPTAPWPWADTYPVARLRIPRLGYDEFVLEGATPRTMAFGPARLLSGAGFGESGNLVLAGHRTSWFRPLESIAPDDIIEIEWLDRKHRVHDSRYTVAAIRVTDPQDVSFLTPTPDEVLTLITCYPFGRSPRSPQRFIVRATPLEVGAGTKFAAAGKVPD